MTCFTENVKKVMRPAALLWGMLCCLLIAQPANAQAPELKGPEVMGAGQTTELTLTYDEDIYTLDSVVSDQPDIAGVAVTEDGITLLAKESGRATLTATLKKKDDALAGSDISVSCTVNIFALDKTMVKLLIEGRETISIVDPSQVPSFAAVLNGNDAAAKTRLENIIGSLKLVSGDSNIVSLTNNTDLVYTATGRLGGKNTALQLIYTDVDNANPVELDSCTASVEALKLSPESAAVTKGQQITLAVTGLASGYTPTFSSSDSSIASVDTNGVVSGLKYGKVTITAEYSGNQCQASVQVYDPKINTTSLLKAKTTSYTLKVTQSSGKITWSSSNTKVAAVSGGKVSMKGAGSCVITAKVDGVELKCSVTVVYKYFDQWEVDLTQNQTCRLNLYGMAVNGVWSSTNPGVVSVDQTGLCRAVGAGDAVIKYTFDGVSCECYFVSNRAGAFATFAPTLTQGQMGVAQLAKKAFGSKTAYRVMQGSCTDGTYAYYVFSSINGGSKCGIVKIRLKDWKIIKKRTGVKLYHGNDIAYNGRTKQIVVNNNNGDTYGISYVDPKTLKVKKRIGLNIPVNRLTYNKARDLYVVGVYGTSQLQLRNGSWQQVGTINILSKNCYTRQGIDCDNNYIYILQSNTSKKRNRILVYDWSGRFICQCVLNNGMEGEDLYHIGGRFYLGYYYNHGVTYTTSLTYGYNVRYIANGGKGSMGMAYVNRGSGLKLAKNKLTRKKYKFMGWKITRSSDGAYLYTNGQTYGWYKPGHQPGGWQMHVAKNKATLGCLSSQSGELITMIAQWKKK